MYQCCISVAHKHDGHFLLVLVRDGISLKKIFWRTIHCVIKRIVGSDMFSGNVILNYNYYFLFISALTTNPRRDWTLLN